jgi:hypothetical protein
MRPALVQRREDRGEAGTFDHSYAFARAPRELVDQILLEADILAVRPQVAGGGRVARQDDDLVRLVVGHDRPMKPLSRIAGRQQQQYRGRHQLGQRLQGAVPFGSVLTHHVQFASKTPVPTDQIGC